MAVSVAIPTYNSEAYLERAVRSVMDQTLQDVEIIIVDDGSSDRTFAIGQKLAQTDSRIKVERMQQNGGPSAARNRALEIARGRWFAVLDSDDLYARDRLRQLVAAGEAEGADIIADNLIVFDSEDSTQAEFFLDPTLCSGWLTLGSYLQRTLMYSKGQNLGYLKPVIKMERLQQVGVRYNPALRIAEDDDLIVRLLMKGLAYWLHPEPLYAYRRHANSISHRLSAISAAAIETAGIATASTGECIPTDLREALWARSAAFTRAAGFARLIDALKERQYLSAALEVARQPQIALLLRMPLVAAFRRVAGRSVAKGFSNANPQAAIALAQNFEYLRHHP